MYAVIENGNKQYKVQEGDVVRLEKLKANEGDTVSFGAMLVSDENGIRTGAPVPHGETRRRGRIFLPFPSRIPRRDGSLR